MAIQLTEDKLRKIIRDEISTNPSITKLDRRVDALEKRVDSGFKSLDGRLIDLEKDFISFKTEFTEFKNQNLSLLDAIYKLLKNSGQELLATKHKVYDNHEPRITKLEGGPLSLGYQ